MSSSAGEVRVVDYQPRHWEHFVTLNLDWITRYFELEDADREVFDDPEAAIIAPGGSIVMAETDEEVLGTCALIRLDDDVYELAKMAVKPSAQGLGIGYLLGDAVVERARRAGAKRVELLSNTKLLPALGLYRKLGFREAPLDSAGYRRADIRMVLDLKQPAASEAGGTI